MEVHTLSFIRDTMTFGMDTLNDTFKYGLKRYLLLKSVVYRVTPPLTVADLCVPKVVNVSEEALFKHIAQASLYSHLCPALLFMHSKLEKRGARARAPSTRW